MRNLIFTIFFIQVVLAASAQANKQIGEPVSCSLEKTQVSLFCDKMIESNEYCETATMIYNFDNKRIKTVKGKINWDIVTKSAEYFFLKGTRKETSVQAFNAATTVVGKILLGAIEYPRALAQDAQYTETLRENSTIFSRAVAILTGLEKGQESADYCFGNLGRYQGLETLEVLIILENYDE